MKNVLADKSYKFSLEIMRVFKYIVKDKNEYTLGKQLLRSGTAIGALIREAEFAQSKADFINKLSISLKEANETRYWLSLLSDSNYIELGSAEKLIKECSELIALLVSSINTSKKSLKK